MLEQLGLDRADYGLAAMIGDRKFDILGAHEAGIDGIGVRYGFAPAGELEAAGAASIADTVDDLARLFLGEESA